METDEVDSAVVGRLAETDDWDELARLGMAHSQYATCDVVLLPEPHGWWDDECTPYAVFTRIPELTYTHAITLVTDAIHRRTVKLVDACEGMSHNRPDTEDGDVDVSIDIDDLGSAIRAGMKYGKRYPTVSLTATETGAPVLRFGSDESERGDDEDELNRLLDRL